MLNKRRGGNTMAVLRIFFRFLLFTSAVLRNTEMGLQQGEQLDSVYRKSIAQQRQVRQNNWFSECLLGNHTKWGLSTQLWLTLTVSLRRADDDWILNLRWMFPVRPVSPRRSAWSRITAYSQSYLWLQWWHVLWLFCKVWWVRGKC